jgi:biotin carboxyl carrier protein
MMTYEYTVHVAPSPGATHAKDHRQCHVLVELLAPERYRVVIDGVPAIVSARQVETAGASGTWSLIALGAEGADPAAPACGPQRVVDVDTAGEDLRVTVGGVEPLFVQVHDLRDRLVQGDEPAGEGAAGELRAAMPGKVVKLLSKPGDVVKSGQSLMVIEAMKMENELRSPAAGRIGEIAVREGQTVEAGQLLLALGPV